VEYLSGKSNAELITEFQNVLRAHCGQHWPFQYLEHRKNITKAEGGIIYMFPSPYDTFTSSLDIAVSSGLFSYAQEVLFNHHVMLDEKQLGSLLYWAYLGISDNYAHDPYDSLPGLRHKIHQFLTLLLKRGANPNTRISIHHILYDQMTKARMEGVKSRKAEEEAEAEDRTEYGDPQSVIADDEIEVREEAEKDQKLNGVYSCDRIEERVEQPQLSHETDADVATNSDSLKSLTFKAAPIQVYLEDYMEMSVLHYALGLETVTDRWDKRSEALLDAICPLVNYGADVNEKPLRTLWLSGGPGFPPASESQSALHYLIRRSSSLENIFEKRQSGPVPAQLVKDFLEHGADPNAIDSDDLTVLECALPTCPYDVIESMLEKGAKITPKLVSESGAPKKYFPEETRSDGKISEVPHVPAGDILNEMRWRRPECYTDEARELARPHNPHWAELENVEKKTATMSFASRLWTQVRFS
jgi:hypothetical protein